MTKLLNKKQALILSVLAAATLTLALCMWAAGIFDDQTAPVTASTAWETVRDPRPSLNEHIAWETRLGGSGNEKLVGALCHDDKIVVFGNTDSTDCDFTERTGERGFIAVLSDSGRTERFLETDSIRTVTPHEQGYLLGIGGESPRLRLYDFDLGFVSETPLYGTMKEEIADVVLTDEGYTVVTTVENTATGSDAVRVIFYDRALNKRTNTLITRSAKLEYVGLFTYPTKTVVAVNFISGIVDCLTFVELKGGSPVFYDVNAEGGFTACDVIPYSDGYAALIRSGGKADILTVNANYTAAKRIYLSAAQCASGMLLPAEDALYAYLHKTGDMSQLCKLDANLNYVGSIAEANTLSGAHDFFSQGAYTNILCSAGSDTVIVSVGKEIQTVRLAVEVQNAQWLRTKKGLVIVAESLFGADCPGQLGGTDISVIRVI